MAANWEGNYFHRNCSFHPKDRPSQDWSRASLGWFHHHRAHRGARRKISCKAPQKRYPRHGSVDVSRKTTWYHNRTLTRAYHTYVSALMMVVSLYCLPLGSLGTRSVLVASARHWKASYFTSPICSPIAS
jgi:hypothetical protein